MKSVNKEMKSAQEITRTSLHAHTYIRLLLDFLASITIRRCLSQNTQIQLPMIDSYWFYKLPTLPLPGSFATVRDPAMARLPPRLRDRPNDPSSRRLPSAFEQVRATPLQHQRSVGGAQP
ncbi:hypothetical protein P152DRAFT_141206 [Eremomyces bilateralis CBS 781.70]|uniref:Uncharacterized protein n=1 Tax=Eremomyces bilateralis CBS 781.70 TaxID=1392243 RepID=A0A6G1FWK8_9PEZI|nr:uncharacterized protein P152DRAFT_141206 [Eremomyces bilateralis CBS 781.70]KAF1810154.1 hypothetical protein P152DRAFT_141206 [Eremomyces bilateralis CBS 781.70]